MQNKRIRVCRIKEEAAYLTTLYFYDEKNNLVYEIIKSISTYDNEESNRRELLNFISEAKQDVYALETISK